MKSNASRDRDGVGEKRNLPLDIPPRFMLEIRSPNGNWAEWGVYLARHRQHLDDGSYVCAGYPYGSPTWLRCIAYRDGFVEPSMAAAMA